LSTTIIDIRVVGEEGVFAKGAFDTTTLGTVPSRFIEHTDGVQGFGLKRLIILHLRGWWDMEACGAVMARVIGVGNDTEGGCAHLYEYKDLPGFCFLYPSLLRGLGLDGFRPRFRKPGTGEKGEEVRGR